MTSPDYLKPLVDYLKGLKTSPDDSIRYSERIILSQGWTKEEITQAIAEIERLEETKPAAKPSSRKKLLIALAVVAAIIFYFTFVRADDLPQSFVDCIMSNSSFCASVVQGINDIKPVFHNDSILKSSTSNLTQSTPSKISNQDAAINVISPSQNGASNVTVNSSSVSSMNDLMDKAPILVVYSNENNTAWVVDNKQATGWLKTAVWSWVKNELRS